MKSVENKKTEDIIRRAEEILATAKLGYEDWSSTNKTRKFSGLRNLIVFGRSVTFVIQNLKSSENNFEEWYLEIQNELKQDPLMKYFVDVRNNILKQGKMEVSTTAHLSNFSPSDIHKFGTPPPGATSFFIGDDIGGSGWLISLPDGSEEKYYMDLPRSIGEVKQSFSDLPEVIDDELKRKSIDELCLLYLMKLESILDRARKEFLNNEVQVINGRRLPPFLRVVK
ncbi:hypothetical protein ACVBIO_07445 [Shewanella sp. 0m-8]